MRPSTASIAVLALTTFLIGIALPARAADEYDVTIVFMGLMTFVPESGAATVIIPAVKTTSLGDDRHPVDSHVAYILANSKTTLLDSDPMNLDDDFDDAAHEGTTYHYVELHGDQIALDDENDVPLLNAALQYQTGGTKCPDDAQSNMTSLHWLSSMTSVTGAGQVPHDPHFSRRPSKTLIAARAVLRYGFLEAHVIKPGYVWEFKKPVSSGPQGPVVHTQAMAQEVHWKFRARGIPFVLNLLSFSDDSRRIAFNPTDGKLTIIIGNTTQKDTGPIATPQVVNRDDHYSVYHTFINGNENDGKGPIPHRKSNENCNAAYLFDPALTPVASTSAPMGGHGQDGDPTPSGLNCSANTWP